MSSCWWGFNGKITPRAASRGYTKHGKASHIHRSRRSEGENSAGFANFVRRNPQIRPYGEDAVEYRDRHRIQRPARRGDAASAGERDRPCESPSHAPHAAYVQLLRGIPQGREELRPDLRPPALRLSERIGRLPRPRAGHRHRGHGRGVPAPGPCALLPPRPDPRHPPRTPYRRVHLLLLRGQPKRCTSPSASARPSSTAWQPSARSSATPSTA